MEWFKIKRKTLCQVCQLSNISRRLNQPTKRIKIFLINIPCLFHFLFSGHCEGISFKVEFSQEFLTLCDVAFHIKWHLAFYFCTLNVDITDKLKIITDNFNFWSFFFISLPLCLNDKGMWKISKIFSLWILKYKAQVHIHVQLCL